jgi:hypothetical protein
MAAKRMALASVIKIIFVIRIHKGCFAFLDFFIVAIF